MGMKPRPKPPINLMRVMWVVKIDDLYQTALDELTCDIAEAELHSVKPSPSQGEPVKAVVYIREID